MRQVEEDIEAWVAAAPDRHLAFLQKCEAAARRVLEATDPHATYEAASEFFGPAAEHSLAHEEASALAYIWPCLTDAMDAPGTGGEEADAAAEAEMKQAAAEWLVACPDADQRREYLRRWSAKFMPE